MNAKLEGVEDLIEFIKASASKLPFDNSMFDAVVSCLTFHEVKDEKNKGAVISEAIRVLKEGGNFVFIDLFKDQSIFGSLGELENSIKNLGISEFHLQDLSSVVEIPKFLLSKRILGNAMVMTGMKMSDSSNHESD